MLGLQRLRELAGIVTPETILRWHRRLVALQVRVVAGLIFVCLADEPHYTEYDGGITSFIHFPLIWYVVSNDHALLTRFTPVSPLETELELTWLVRDDAVEGRDYDPETVCWLWRVTAEQDKTICENNQRGILSSRYQPCCPAAAEVSLFMRLPFP